MGKYQPAAQSLMAVYIAVAATLLWVTVTRSALAVGELPRFLVLSAIAAVTLLVPIKSARGQGSLSLGNVFVFAAVLIMPLPWPLLLSAGIWVVLLLKRLPSRAPNFWVDPLVHASQLVMSVAAAFWVLDVSGAAKLSSMADMLWVSASALVFVAVQTLLSACLGSVSRRVPWSSLEVLCIDSLLTEIAAPLGGVVVAVLYRVNPATLMLVVAMIALELRVLRGTQMVQAADLDPLTGIYSYRYFEGQIRAEVVRAVSMHRPLALIIGDLDHLRDINAAFGHPSGDQAIQRAASVFQSVGGANGVAARFGGEEFVLLLPGTDVQEAGYLAERVRDAVERIRIPVGADQVFSMTVSLGVSVAPQDGTTVQALVTAADAALHRAKSSGRNRVASTGATQDPLTRQAMRSADALPPYALRDRARTPAAAESAAAGPHPGSQILPVLIMLGGVALTAWSVTVLQQDTQWVPLGILVVIGAAAQVLKVLIYGEDGTPRSLSPSMLVTMAAGAYLGIAEAVVVNLAAVIVQVSTMKRRTPVTRVATNVGMAVLTATAGALPFALIRSQQVSDLYVVLGPLAIIAGASLYYLANVGLMVVLIALEKRQNCLTVWRKGMAWATPYYFSLTVTGGLTGYFQVLLGWPGTVTILALQLLLFRTFQQQASNMMTAVNTLQEAQDVLAHANRTEKKSLRELTEAISAIIDTRDANVYGHSRQVARYAVAIAGELGVTEEVMVDRIRTGALLHDLGKVGIPESILHKPGSLTADEYEIVKQHTVIGERILTEIESFSDVAALVGNHHERWDGAGYPRGVCGADIPLGARILAAADTLDSMLSDRPYSRARSLKAALAELDRCAGQQFDPEIVAAVHRLVLRMPAQFFQNSFQGEAVFPGTIPGLITTLKDRTTA